jgi:hypothetical protein
METYRVIHGSSQRDAFGVLHPIDGEASSGKCCVCRGRATTVRSSQTTSLGFCNEHAAAYDRGEVSGSLIAGYHQKITHHT